LGGWAVDVCITGFEIYNTTCNEFSWFEALISFPAPINKEETASSNHAATIIQLRNDTKILTLSRNPGERHQQTAPLKHCFGKQLGALCTTSVAFT